MRMQVRCKGYVNVERPDSDGDIYFSTEDWGVYYDVKSVKRLIKALQWAISPTQRRNE